MKVLGISMMSCIVIACALLVVPAAVEGQDIVVDDDWIGADHDNIQDAINAASADDVIQVNAGQYDEDIVVNQTVTIQGNGTTETIINGTGSNEAVSIQSSNVVLSNIGIDANPLVEGVYISAADFIINNCTIEDADDAIRVSAASATIDNCTISNSRYGVLCPTQMYLTVKGCTFSNLQTASVRLVTSVFLVSTDNVFDPNGLQIDGTGPSSFDTHTIVNCTTNGKPVYYADDDADLTVTGEYGQVIIGDCDNVTLRDMEFTRGGWTIVVGSSSWTNITNVTINDTLRAIYVRGCDNTTITETYCRNSSSYNALTLDRSADSMVDGLEVVGGDGMEIAYLSDRTTIVNSTFTDCGEGLLVYADDVLLENVNFTGCRYGPFLQSGDGAIVRNCYIEDSTDHQLYVRSSNATIENCTMRGGAEHGMLFQQNGHNATVKYNDFIDNTLYGIYIVDPAHNNTFHNNRFIGNGGSTQASDNGPDNTWDDGVIGNNWSTYTGRDMDGDDIGDTPYSIAGSSSSEDRYPIKVEIIDTWTVDDDWAGADFDNIQEAVNESSPGDTIRVHAGWYNESVNVTVRVNILGNGTDEGNMSYISGNSISFNISAENVTVQGFYIDVVSVGCQLSGGHNATVRQNTFIGSTGRNGVQTFDSNDPRIEWNTFTGTSNSIVIFDRIGGIVANNTIHGVTGSSGWVGINAASFGMMIENNRVNNTGTGIKLNNADGSVVRDNEVGNISFSGIYVNNVDQLDVLDNYIGDNDGLTFYGDRNVVFRNNTFVRTGFNFHSGFSAMDNLVFDNNTANGLPIVVLEGNSSETVTGEFGQLIMRDCHDMLLSGLGINETSYAITLLDGNNITVASGYFADCRYGVFARGTTDLTVLDTMTLNAESGGIYLYGVNYINISRHTSFDDRGVYLSTAGTIRIDNSSYTGVSDAIYGAVNGMVLADTVFENCGYGTRLTGGDDISVSNVTTLNGTYGLHFLDVDKISVNGSTFQETTIPVTIFDDTNPGTGDWTNVTHCTVTGGNYGVLVVGADNCTIRNNTFQDTRYHAVMLQSGAGNNNVYWNRFEYCGGTDSQGYDDGTGNLWDNGSLGNYWSDYDGVDDNNDSIGDTPYDIDGGSAQDRYPIYEEYIPVVYTVDDDWAGANFSSVQDAIDSTNPRDIIMVHAGTYDEDVTVDKTLTIIGNGTDATYINASSNMVTVDADDVVLAHMNITGSNYCIYGTSTSDVLIENCSIEAGQVGIYFSFSSRVHVRNCTFDQGYMYQGVLLNQGSGSVITGNYFEGLNYGVWSNRVNAIVQNNTFVNSYGGVYVERTTGANISHNLFEDSNLGISIYNADGDEIFNNTLIDCAVFGILLWDAQTIIHDNEMYGCSISMGGSDMGAFDSHDLANNTVNDLPILYLVGGGPQTVDGDWGEVILVDCEGVTVDDVSIGNTTDGIIAYYCSNLTLRDVQLWECYAGVSLGHSNGTLFENLSTEENNYAIRIEEVSDLWVEGMSSEYDTWAMGPWSSEMSDNITFANSTVQGASNGIAPSFVRDLVIENCSFDGHRGVSLDNCNNVTIRDSVFECITYGIYLSTIVDVEIVNCNITGNNIDLIMYTSMRAVVRSNNFTGGIHGIQTNGGGEYLIEDNTFRDYSNYGVYLYNTDNSTVRSNDFSDGTYGIFLGMNTENNTVYMNYVEDCSGSSYGYDDGAYNSWDNGTIGNYWGNYDGPDDDWDNIGDWPYNITGSANSTDRYPIYIHVIIPDLDDPMVSPADGNIGTVFNFTVTYSHMDGDPAGDVIVYIDGTPFDMTAAGTGNWTTGWEFYYETSLDRSSHVYNFTASDGEDWNTTGTFDGPDVSNRLPALGDASMYPANATEGVQMTFNVTYTDADDDAPASIEIEIDGSSYPMDAVDSGDTDYTDGAVFTYVTLLDPGNRSYNFTASDGLNVTFLIGGVVEVNESTGPIKPFAHIDDMSPNPAASTDTVEFSGHGSGGTILGYNWTSDVDGPLSNASFFNTTTLSRGWHNISLTVLNDDDLWSDPAVETLRVNNPPDLANGSVTPTVAYAETEFRFTVEFIDPDPEDNPSPYVTVFVGGSFRLMSLVDGTDNLYELNHTLSYGVWEFGFRVSDDLESKMGEMYSLRVNRPPVLTDPAVSPGEGNETTLFTFSVTYTDAENDTPTGIELVIDNETYTMTAASPGDTDYTNGAVFIYSTLLGAGNHTFNFTGNDGLQIGFVGGAADLEVNESTGPIKPFAVIDSITPSPADANETVRFIGHGSGGTILEYEWSSDVDGVLGDTADLNFTTGFSVTTHNITFRVRNEDMWSDAVTAGLSITSSVGRPDLEITSISLGPVSVNLSAGDVLTIYINVRNRGNVSANVTVGLYMIALGTSYSSPADLDELETFDVQVLVNDKANITYDWTAVEGNWTIVAWADPSNDVIELWENNNIGETDVSVAEGPAGGEGKGDKGDSGALLAGILVAVVVLIVLLAKRRRPRGERMPYDDDRGEDRDGEEPYDDADEDFHDDDSGDGSDDERPSGEDGDFDRGDEPPLGEDSVVDPEGGPPGHDDEVGDTGPEDGPDDPLSGETPDDGPGDLPEEPADVDDGSSDRSFVD